MAELRQNTWTLGQWYDQDVAGNVSYNTTLYSLYLAGEQKTNTGSMGQNGPITTDYSSPTQIPGNWMSACWGDGAWVLAVKEGGTIWSWGDGWGGALGLNDQLKYSSPTQIGTDTDWSSGIDRISATAYHSLAVKTTGELWSWGYNVQGQLGLNDKSKCSSPTQVGTDTDWSKVSSGHYSSIALKTDGTLWSWGDGAGGQTGQDTTGDYSSPKQVGTDTTWNQVYMNQMGPAPTGGLATFATKTDGTLWTWGGNAMSQLGHNNLTNYSSPKQLPGTTWSGGEFGKMSVSYENAGAIKTDGTLWAWGRNTYGGLGQNDKTDRSSPVQVGTDTTWKYVDCGSYTMSAVKTDGTLWVWGPNYGGSLGINKSFSSNPGVSSPMQVGTETNWYYAYARSTGSASINAFFREQ